MEVNTLSIIDIIANVGVAIGTLFLAAVTWKSVQTTNQTLTELKNQVDLERKNIEYKQSELEKPQILEQLKNVFNPLKNSLDRELQNLSENVFFWESLRWYEGYKYSPNIIYSEFFDKPDPSNSLGLIIYNITINNENFLEECHKRHKIINEMFELLNQINNELKKKEIYQKINETLKKHSDYIRHPNGCDPFGEQLWREAIQLVDYSLENGFSEQIIPLDSYKAIFISTKMVDFLSEKVNPNDSLNQTIIQDSSGLMKEDFKVFFSLSEIKECPTKYHQLTKELKIVDESLVNKIKNIRLHYQKKYHLTNEELWIIMDTKVALDK